MKVKYKTNVTKVPVSITLSFKDLVDWLHSKEEPVDLQWEGLNDWTYVHSDGDTYQGTSAFDNKNQRLVITINTGD